ncbi:MAG: glycosyltransferase family 2 protein [Candidatus Nanopelagicales bacterium]
MSTVAPWELKIVIDMTGPLPPLAVVVVNYGSHALLEENLTWVASEVPEATVVVVDNFSSRGELDAVAALCEASGWELVPLASNEGFGLGVNAGVARARELGSLAFLILNPDARIDGHSARLLWHRVSREPATMVGPTVLNEVGAVWSQGTYLYLDDGSMGSVTRHSERAARPHCFWVSGACFAISDALWTELRGFDARYFLYWEDVDLSYRATMAGAAVVVDPEAHAVHAEGGTQTAASQQAKSDVYYYYNTRNRLAFAALNLSRPGQERWLRRSLPAGYRIVARGGRRQFLRPWGPLKSAAAGTWAGRRMMSELTPSTESL